MSSTGDVDSNSPRGVLITSADGIIYNIPFDALERFRVPQEDVDQVIRDAEQAGLLPASGSCDEQDQEQEPGAAASPIGSPRTVINIFVGGGGDPQVTLQDDGPEKSVGSAMSKYAAGSTMSKYAAGSTMSKYAAGSTMSKYAAGSTMSKYAAGSTMAVPGQTAVPAAVFYGAWDKS